MSISDSIDFCSPFIFAKNLRSWLAVVLSVSLVLMFGEIIPSAVFTGSEQLTMAARFSGLVGCSTCRLVRVKVASVWWLEK